MRHLIPRRDWHMKLAEAIQKASEGDTIVCFDEEMQELGERARLRMCPDKPLKFKLPSEVTP